MKNHVLLCSITVLFLLIIFVSNGCKDKVTAPTNQNPIITSVVAFPDSVFSSDSFAVVCSAYDPDGQSVVYDWSCTSGATIKGADPLNPSMLYNTTENIRQFYAPDSAHTTQDSIRVFVDVRDGIGGGKSAWVFIKLSKR